MSSYQCVMHRAFGCAALQQQLAGRSRLGVRPPHHHRTGTTARQISNRPPSCTLSCASLRITSLPPIWSLVLPIRSFSVGAAGAAAASESDDATPLKPQRTVDPAQHDRWMKSQERAREAAAAAAAEAAAARKARGDSGSGGGSEHGGRSGASDTRTSGSRDIPFDGYLIACVVLTNVCYFALSPDMSSLSSSSAPPSADDAAAVQRFLDSCVASEHNLDAKRWHTLLLNGFMHTQRDELLVSMGVFVACSRGLVRAIGTRGLVPVYLVGTALPALAALLIDKMRNRRLSPSDTSSPSVWHR